MTDEFSEPFYYKSKAELIKSDRLFVSLLSAAFIHLAWLGLTDFSLWFATIISFVFAVFVFKFV